MINHHYARNYNEDETSVNEDIGNEVESTDLKKRKGSKSGKGRSRGRNSRGGGDTDSEFDKRDSFDKKYSGKLGCVGCIAIVP